jgi:hypothetical protein
MQIELRQPIAHGQPDAEGKLTSIEYSRGVYQTDNPKKANYLALALAEEFTKLEDAHTGEPIACEWKPPAPPEGQAETTKAKKDK